VVGLFYSHNRQEAGQVIAENFLNNAPVVEVTGLPPFLAGVAGGAPFGPGSSAPLNYFGVPLLPGSVSWTANIATLDKQEAAFVQTNVKITRQLKLTAGVRVSRNELTVDGTYGGPENNNNYAYGGPCPAGVNAAGTACVDSYPVTQSKRSETSTTPKVGVEFQLDEANLFYATAAKGFRPAGASLLVPVSQCAQDLQTIGYVDPAIPLAAIKQSDSKQPAVFGSDSVWSYELGSKNRLFDGHAIVDASVYRIKWSNIQSSVALPLCGYAFADNVGHATAQGFDLGLRGTPIRGLELGGTLGYNKTTFDEDARTPNGILLYTKGSGVPGVGAPLTFSASAQYDFNLFRDHGFYVRADLTHSSTERAAGVTSPTSSTYQPLYKSVQSYSVLNTRLGTRVLGGGDLSVFVNNLTNSHPDLALGRGGAPGGYPSVWTDATLRPRTYGVTFLYHY
jgi:outer membrane receptor protein involved in Fe transport